MGGVVSPVLSNIYLHYVLDLWFERRYAKTCQGKASLVRFADDFIACFQDEKDARRFLIELQKRLADFSLEVESSKTAVIRFGSNAEQSTNTKGKDGARTFNFLGFTHYVSRSRSGRFAVGRKTEGKRIRRKLKEVKVRLILLSAQGGKAMFDYIKQHLQGHIQYYGVSGNDRSLKLYVRALEEVLFKWLNRRSQRSSMVWERFRKIMKTILPPVRIVHNLYPKPPWKT